MNCGRSSRRWGGCRVETRGNTLLRAPTASRFPRTISKWDVRRRKGSGKSVRCRRVIATLRTFDAVSPRQYPPKKYRLAVTTLRTPDARSAQSNIVIVRFQSYAPTLRCRCVVTPRLVANKDYVTMPLAPPSKRLRCLCEMFSFGHRLAS